MLKNIFDLQYTINENAEIFNKRGAKMKDWDNGQGYRYISFTTKAGRKNFYVHRIMAELFLEKQIDRPHVNHINGIKSDNRLENLEWCSMQENMIHASKNGLMATGEDSGMSKLTELQVLDIRLAVAIGIHRDEIKKKYDISFAQIHRIHTQKLWVHKMML